MRAAPPPPPLLLLLLVAKGTCRVCTEAQQSTDGLVGNGGAYPLGNAVSETVQTAADFTIRLHFGPLDKYPYTHEVFEVGCGDRSTTIATDAAVLSAFTNDCYYQSGTATQSSGNTPQEKGCDTWVEVSWLDTERPPGVERSTVQQGIHQTWDRNYSVVAFNSKGEPLWVVNSVNTSDVAQDLTNCFASDVERCHAHHPRHGCGWQNITGFPYLVRDSANNGGRFFGTGPHVDCNLPCVSGNPCPNPADCVRWNYSHLWHNVTGTNQAYDRCVGRNSRGGFLDLNYHGPIDRNDHLGSQAMQPGQVGGGQADSHYVGTYKQYWARGHQLQGTERITFMLLRHEVFDHPPLPWIPDSSNLQLSWKTQFMTPVGVLWYWAHGLDTYGSQYQPRACNVVPNEGYWDEAVTITFDCGDCKAGVVRVAGQEPAASSDRMPVQAWDGSAVTYYESWHDSGGWIRAEFDRALPIRRIRFRPAVGHASAMLNGRFGALREAEGTEELIGVVQSTPADNPGWTEMYQHHTTAAFKHVIYHCPAASRCRVADIEVFFWCRGAHTHETNVVKAVQHGLGDAACTGSPAYGTTEGRTDRECLYRPSSECFSFSDLCEWEPVSGVCVQKTPASKRTFTFQKPTTAASTERVQFCYEGQPIWPNGTFTIKTRPAGTPGTPAPIATPPPPGTVIVPSPGAPLFTPYPVYSPSPQSPAPPTPTPATPEPVPAATAPPTPAPSFAAAPTPAPTPSPGASVGLPPTPEELSRSLAITPVVGPSGQLYSHMSDPWLGTSGEPLRTAAFVLRDAEVALQALASNPAAFESASVRCSLRDPHGSFADTPFGRHSLPSVLTGGSAPLQAGHAFLLNMRVSSPYARRSLYAVNCSVLAGGVHGVSFDRTLLLAPAGVTRDGASQTGAGVTIPAGTLRTVVLRIGVPPQDVVFRTVEEAVAGALGIEAGAVRVLRAGLSAAGRGHGALLPLQTAGCTLDPAWSRSSLLWVALDAAGSGKTHEQLVLSLLEMTTNATSLLARDLCGILESYADFLPSTWTSPAPGPTVPATPVPGVGTTPLTPPPTDAAGTPVARQTGGGGTSLTPIIAAVAAGALLCCLAALAFAVYRRRRSRESLPPPKLSRGARTASRGVPGSPSPAVRSVGRSAALSTAASDGAVRRQSESEQDVLIIPGSPAAATPNPIASVFHTVRQPARSHRRYTTDLSVTESGTEQPPPSPTLVRSRPSVRSAGVS
eukprot:TRINITY_DN26719_c2_g1_i1.p1 TRINITY_DN26719_c2_g1~~TRINITY_DN26719_c2_g1_i1.p1  ORF type:complete len:1247 (+),score=290.37 TRINITY_DN26719_c2_g1_i1:55-3741(+)